MPLHTGSIKYVVTNTEPPSTQGNTYYDLSEKRLKHYDGTEWAAVNKKTNFDRPGDSRYSSDSATLMLIHSNDADNSTSFFDSGDTGHTITRNADVIHDTAQKVSNLGASSIYFDGSADCYLTVVGSDSHADFNVGTGDYTIECWMKSDGASSDWGAMIDNRDRTGWYGLGHFALTPNGYLRLHHNLGTTGGTSNAEVDDGNWHHVAYVRDSGTGKTYVDGVEKASASMSGDASATCVVRLGVSDHGLGGTPEPFKGWLHEPRISSVARWISNFIIY